MYRSLPHSNFINFMNSTDSSTHSILSQAGFTVCPTFSAIPLILNSSHKAYQNNSFAEDTSKIDEQQLRWKLLSIFKKDKIKYQSICDQYMNVMELEKVCENVRALCDFINKTVMEDFKPISGHKNNFDGSSKSQSNQSSNEKKSLMIFSTQVSFLSTIFSRDKIEVILQVHTSHQKLQNFLNFLGVSLQSFIFTNEKEWILLKDEIERYFIKYEKNVSKLLEVTESEMKAKEQKQNSEQKQNIQSNQLKLAQVNPEIYGQCQINTRLQDEMNLKQYKKDINTIKEKIKELQSTMCSAIRNSFITWYQKFETIVENLKSEMAYVCKLLQKAKKFENSAEKFQIIDFLLITRAKGLEVIVFSEQIYKTILMKLEYSREKLSHRVNYAANTKLTNIKSKQHADLVKKERQTVQTANKIFKKLENLLGIKIERGAISEIQVIEQTEGEGNDEQKKNKKPTGYPEKEKKIKKDRKDNQKYHQKKEMNIILQSPQKKALQIEMDHEISNNNNPQSQPNSQSCSLRAQKMIQQPLSQSQSSSLQFLMSRQPEPLKPPHKKSDDSLAFDQMIKKVQWSKSPPNSDDIEPLSIEEQIELDFGQMKSMDSDELMMFDKGFNEEEIKRMENGGLMENNE